MTKANLYPFINRFTGDVKVLTKKEGKLLNEDWEHAKVVKNAQGEKVFRFRISAPVKGPDGRIHTGTAIVDLTETEMPAEGLEAANGERQPE